MNVDGQEKLCTYKSLGEGARQVVYTCFICAKLGQDGKLVKSGFCEACKEACHAEHLDAVMEVSTRRGFRCDCGNTKMLNTCCLAPEKEAKNVGNKYGQNFDGRYCRCKHTYDGSGMMQCVVCEDWFHEECLILPDNGDTKRIANISCELICAQCTEANSVRTQFLDAYFEKYGLFRPKHGIGTVITELPQVLSKDITRNENPTPPKAGEIDVKVRLDCTRPDPCVKSASLRGKDQIWPAGFRQYLCICATCKREYRRAGVEYLVNCEDSPDLAGYLTDRERMRVRKYIVKCIEDALERGLVLDKAALVQGMEKLRDEIVESGRHCMA